MEIGAITTTRKDIDNPRIKLTGINDINSWVIKIDKKEQILRLLWIENTCKN